MKIIGLITCCWDPNRSRHACVEQLCSVTDGAIMYDDGTPMEYRQPFHNLMESVRNESPNVWTDYANRLTLLARATAHDADWVLWLDDDEWLMNMTKDRIRAIVEAAEMEGASLVRFKKYEMWTETESRIDGIWGTKQKIMLQKNPFMGSSIEWRSGHLNRLHSLPFQKGNVFDVPDVMLHYGMCNPELRQERVSKYKRIDPGSKFQSIGYDYLLDETGLQLEPVSLDNRLKI